MSFQNVKPTKPELDRIKKKRQFSQKGQNLLEIKHDQLSNSLKSILDRNFDLRRTLQKKIRNNMNLLEQTYETIGKQKVVRVSRVNEIAYDTSVDITYLHEKGIDKPKIELKMNEKSLPSYSFSDTSLHLDLLIKDLKSTIQSLVELAELDSMMYRIADDNRKVQRRIDALDDIIIPQLDSNIRAIEEILTDEEREEFIRIKKIKELLDIDEK